MADNIADVRVDHIGIAVDSVKTAEPVLRALGCEKLIDDTVEGRFRWVYYELGDASRIELIEPIEEGTFLTDFLKQYGPGLHHVTLEVADIDSTSKDLREVGIEIIDRRSYEGWTEAFVSPQNSTGVLFQLMEYHEPFAAERELGAGSLFINGQRLSRSE